MSEGGPDQPMEEILASIRRVISADSEAARRLPPAPADDVLELGEAPDAEPALLSPRAEQASRAALAGLTGLKVDPAAAGNTLDGMVRDMLRPMLKQWLDDNLPEMVERVVTREVARVIGR